VHAARIVMKRSIAELQLDIADSEVRIKRARREIADHDDTLAALLPGFLLDKFVRCAPRVLARFCVEVIEGTDDVSVGAGTAHVTQDEWRCTVQLVDKPEVVVIAHRWDGESFGRPDALAWLEEDWDRYVGVEFASIARTWAALLKLSGEHVELALAALAWAVEKEFGSGVAIRRVFDDETEK
jgi:hypothetical protein